MKENLTNYLKEYRLKNNKSQKELASLLGVSYRTYQAVETSGDIKKSSLWEKIKEVTGYKENTQKIASETISDTALELIRDLVRNNTTVSEAVKASNDTNRITAEAAKVLADTAAELTTMVKTSLDGRRENHVKRDLDLLIEKLARAGVPERWSTVEIGLRVLGNMLAKAEAKEIVQDSH